MNFADIVSCFESLGDNCEFGLVQRAAGIEPLGFFRLAFARLEALLRALDSDFADVGAPEQVEIYTEPNAELMVRIRGYGFQYHTQQNAGDIATEDLHAQQLRVIPFLTRKLLTDLRAAEKIFVRKGDDSTRLDQIEPLFEALRRHGPVTLLWVVVEDEAHPRGTVEVLRPGLLKGYINRFAPYHDAYGMSDIWIDICRAAYALWRGDSPPGMVIRYGAPPPASSLSGQAELAAAAHSRAPDVTPRSTPVRSRLYRRTSLDQIAASGAAMPDGRPRAERIPYLPAETLNVPPFAFGTTDWPDSEAAATLRAEAAGGRFSRPASPAWVLRDVLVHGSYGILTLADSVVDETLLHIPLHRIPASAILSDGQVRLPEYAPSATLPAAYHLLACNQENYFHWLIDALSRFSPAQFVAIGTVPQAPGAPVLLTPQLDVFWKWETANSLIPGLVPRLAMMPEGRMFVQRLIYVPYLFGFGPSFVPHARLLDAFDIIAANILGSAAVRPWRRLYIARTDSQNRKLLNEEEVMARAERAGFTPVVLSSMSVPEQVRLFAEASHILAPHGAGLTNIGFCRPGTKLCELHMDSYLHWAFRRLAALRGLIYGCVLGETVARHDQVHANTWRIDPDAVEAVLHDPRFIGG